MMKPKVNDMANDTKKLAVNETNVTLENLQKLFDSYEREQTGFAPYWEPKPGAMFAGRVIGRDATDPDFVRYLIQAGVDTPCKRGSKIKETTEEVVVPKGDSFTISVYYALKDKFDDYLVSGRMPFIICKAVKEVPTSKSGQTVWTWDLRLSPEDKKAMTEWRAKQIRGDQAGDENALEA